MLTSEVSNTYDRIISRLMSSFSNDCEKAIMEDDYDTTLLNISSIKAKGQCLTDIIGDVIQYHNDEIKKYKDCHSKLVTLTLKAEEHLSKLTFEE